MPEPILVRLSRKGPSLHATEAEERQRCLWFGTLMPVTIQPIVVQSLLGLGRKPTVDIPALRKWLADPRTALTAAVTEGVRAHVNKLRSGGLKFYGYALLPGEPYDIHSLVAVTNTEADIKVASTDEMYRYYRYSVDEWAHWEHEGFASANALLVASKQQFDSMHTKDEDDFQMDEFEIAHANALLEAVVRGLEAAKNGGAFGAPDPFLVVWISDSGHDMMPKSVRRLNSSAVAKEFMREFG